MGWESQYSGSRNSLSDGVKWGLLLLSVILGSLMSTSLRSMLSGMSKKR